MTNEEAIAALDAIPEGAEGEGAHSEADEILLGLVPPDVREAYERVVERASFWACA